MGGKSQTHLLQSEASCGVDALLLSLSRFAGRVQVLEGYRQGNLEAGASRQIGPDLVFGRLWRELGLDRVLTHVLRDRGFEFPVERAVYLTVLIEVRQGRTGTTSEPHCQGWPGKRSKPPGSPSRPRFDQYQKMWCQRIIPPI